MKPTPALRRLLFASAAFAAANSAHAQLYWDTDGATAGFGAASGTWGSDAFWNTSGTGGAGTFSTVTATTDSLNFGNGATGLAAGTIAVSGTVDSGNMTFASGSGAITLTGGTINFAAAPTVTVNNSTNTITSALTGAATSLTKTGTGTLVLSGGGTVAGNLIISAGTVQLGADNGIATTAGIDIFGGTSASRVIDLNGYDQTLSKLVFSATNSAGNLTVTGGANSKLTINTTTDTEIGAGGTTIAADRPVTLDMSGLGEFAWSGSANTFRVGLRFGTSNATNTNAGTMTALLADANTITAGTLAIATVPASNNGATGILRMGQTNTFNFDNINMGTSGRSIATLNFRDGLAGTPTVTIRGTDGTAPVILWEIGRVSHSANSTWTSLADFSAGQVDANVTTLRIGSANASTTGRAGTVNATFTMGKGSLEIGALIVGQYASGTGGTVAASGTFAGNGIFNLNDATGSVKAGDLILADNIGTATGGTNRTASGTFNLLAGTLEATTIGRGANTGNATATTRAFNFTGGTIRNASGNNLSISNVPLNLTGSGPRVFEATTGQSITVASTSVISGVDQGFAKSGDGTLILAATNTYTGVTTINAGTLEVQGSIASSASITNDAALVFNRNAAQSYGNVISGSGTLTKTNTGTLTLSGNNDYTGATVFNNGTVILGHNSALGTTASGTTIVGSPFATTGGTTLNLGSTGITLAENISLNGSSLGRARIYNDAAVDHVLNGNLDVTSSDSGHAQIWNNGGSITINGDITGTLTTNAILFLRGTSTSADNRVLGNINISGNLGKTDGGVWTIGAAGKTYSWGATSISVGTLRMGAANVLPSATVVTLGQNDATAAVLDLNGHSQTVAGIQLPGTPGTGTRTITSASAATLTIGAASNYTYGGVITGSLALTKTGAGTQTITGANTYSGGTTVNAGNLTINGSLADTTMAISGGAVDGTGTLTSSIDGATFDAITLTGGTFTATGLTLNISPTGAGLTQAEYVLVDATGGGTISGTFAALTGAPGYQLNYDTANQIKLVQNPTTGFTSWIGGTFANGTIPEGQRGPNQDFDNDGISNLVEFAIAGEDPTVPNASVGSFNGTTLSFTKRDGTSGLTYAIEESISLGVAPTPWTEVSGGTYTNNGTTISYAFPGGGPPRNFLRLQVISN